MNSVMLFKIICFVLILKVSIAIQEIPLNIRMNICYLSSVEVECCLEFYSKLCMPLRFRTQYELRMTFIFLNCYLEKKRICDRDDMWLTNVKYLLCGPS